MQDIIGSTQSLFYACQWVFREVRGYPTKTKKKLGTSNKGVDYTSTYITYLMKEMQFHSDIYYV